MIILLLNPKKTLKKYLGIRLYHFAMLYIQEMAEDLTLIDHIMDHIQLNQINRL